MRYLLVCFVSSLNPVPASASCVMTSTLLGTPAATPCTPRRLSLRPSESSTNLRQGTRCTRKVLHSELKCKNVSPSSSFGKQNFVLSVNELADCFLPWSLLKSHYLYITLYVTQNNVLFCVKMQHVSSFAFMKVNLFQALWLETLQKKADCATRIIFLTHTFFYP